MKPCVVNVSTGVYVRGQARLKRCASVPVVSWADTMPPGAPSHREIPYAFKPWAMKAAADQGYDLLLWADASIVPLDLTPLLKRIETNGYWISRNGWMNSEWTCDAAYADLGVTPEENSQIPHVVATAFGINLLHPTGKAILDDYLALAKTRAFCGPWWNRNHPDYAHMPPSDRCAPCGSPAVRGHRHDQTALSVVAFRHKCELTNPPEWFAYRGGEEANTILIADGAY